VNDWLARASRWQVGVFVGLLAGLGAAVLVGLVAGGGWRGALTGAVGAGFGGAILGATLLHGQVQRQVEAVGVLSTPVRRAAGRASLWGPAPEDPETREAAAKLAEHALAERQRHRALGVVSSPVVTGMLVNLAVRASPWWWIAVAANVALLVHGWFLLPRRLRRRIELLRGTSPAA
jgi:hypothetical protein